MAEERLQRAHQQLRHDHEEDREQQAVEHGRANELRSIIGLHVAPDAPSPQDLLLMGQADDQEEPLARP